LSLGLSVAAVVPAVAESPWTMPVGGQEPPVVPPGIVIEALPTPPAAPRPSPPVVVPPSASHSPITDAAPCATCVPAPCSSCVPPPAPFDGPICERPKLTGDWLGLRSVLRCDGITFDANLTQYWQGVQSGGVDHNMFYGGRGDYYLNVDGEKVG